MELPLQRSRFRHVTIDHEDPARLPLLIANQIPTTAHVDIHAVFSLLAHFPAPVPRF
jgi:hypothetical protein